jgi:hypothetical protein
MYIKIKEVQKVVKYLIGHNKGSYSCNNIRLNLKSNCNFRIIESAGKCSYFAFLREDVWNNYFMKDELLKTILINNRIGSLDELLQFDYNDGFKYNRNHEKKENIY